MNKKPRDIKIGEYDIRIVGENETTNLPLKKGEIYYMIRIDKESWLDTSSHAHAEIISRLIRIENKLNKKKD